MVEFFSDITTMALAKTLDGVAMRHRVIANNIANVETPGFTRSDVSFEDSLRQAIDSSADMAEGEINSISPEAVPDATSPARPDGNNVTIDREMADLTKNSLSYEALTQLYNLKGSMIRQAITEGRR
jgi:flagellar basal-body rod protein FlgB